MAKFFGTVQGGRGKATRLGHSDLKATAQSYDGSIVTQLYEEDGVTFASIYVSPDSTQVGQHRLYRGPIKGLFSDQVNFGGN